MPSTGSCRIHPYFYFWIYIMVCVNVFWVMINKLKDSYRQGTEYMPVKNVCC